MSIHNKKKIEKNNTIIIDRRFIYMENENKFKIRTDLAVELEEDINKKQNKIDGVKVERRYINDGKISVTRVVITSNEGARAIGKPKGTYITLESEDMGKTGEGYHREMSGALSVYLRALLPVTKDKLTILVAGLGNKNATADSLGPRVVENLCVTRLMNESVGNTELFDNDMYELCAIAPGVLAETGMESAEIIEGVVKKIKADVVIAVDALSARKSNRLNTTIQISNSGINPGSGVENHRMEITKKNIGVPVIAIGIPTVIDAATIVNDTFDNLMEVMKMSGGMETYVKVLKSFNDEEKYQLIKEVISPELQEMYVTPKDEDATVKYISYTISEGLNIIFT